MDSDHLGEEAFDGRDLMERDPKFQNLTVQEILSLLEVEYPEAPIDNVSYGNRLEVSQITFKNGWTVSLSYGRSSYSEGRLLPLDKLLEGTTVEIAIFTPLSDWYLVEGMYVYPGAKTGVLAWQDSEKVFRILDYISQKE